MGAQSSQELTHAYEWYQSLSEPIKKGIERLAKDNNRTLNQQILSNYQDRDKLGWKANGGIIKKKKFII